VAEKKAASKSKSKSTMTAAERSAARSAAAKKAAATRKANKAAAAAAVAPTEAADPEATPAPESGGSKRSGASRAASSSASSARSAAQRSTGAARASSAASTAEARSRAAASASAHRHSQRVAASLTTETTAAERGPRKPTGASTFGAADAPNRDDVDLEATTERRAGSLPTAAAISAATADAAVGDEATAAEVPAEEATADTATADAAGADASDAPADATASVAESSAVAESSTVDSADARTEVGAEAPAEASAPTIAAQAVTVIPAKKAPAPRKKRTLRVARPAPPADAPRVLEITGLVKRFAENTAVDGISLSVRAGSFYGIVGPNGAGKTTTLSMVTGLLRPDAGTVSIHGIDAWADPRAAKRITGVLPDRLRLFDRLTGSQLLYYSGVLRGLDNRTVRERSADLITAFGLDDAVDRLVADYSAGMTKKIALACALIHSPRLLVLDEPFESVDPVSAANLTEILERYVAGGGTVVLSSHGMDLIERVCDSAAIIVSGRVLAAGTLDEVRAGQTLEDRFVELAGGRKAAEGMEWLHSFSD